MSRSRWALTEGCVPVSAVTRGAGKPVGLEEAARPGCLLDAVLSVTRLLWVVAATATALVLVPAPATARSEPSLRAQVATTQPNRNSHAPKASAGAGPVAQRPPARLSRRTATGGHASDAVLARGSGYDEPGGSPLVRRLQHRLALAGFAPGPVDGLYGPRTEVAVSRFQAATGLAIDGIAGSHTLAALYAPRPTLYPGAGYGSGGSRLVRDLQRLLTQTGYNPMGIDGLYGPRTERAVRRFQAARGLQVDGIARLQTFIGLRKRVGEQSRSRPTARHAAPHQKTGPAPRPKTTHPAAGSRKPAEASAPTAARRARHPSGSPSIPWLVLAAAALGLTLLLAISQGTRRRAAQHGSSPTLPSRGGVPVAPPHQSNSAIAGSPDGRASETLERPAAPGAAFRLGVLLEEQNDLAGAEAAYRRADLQGHAAAASNLGVLLERRGDLRGAKAAYRRADERGDPNGAFNLAVLLEEQNDPAGAEAAYRRADLQGHAAAASNLGVLLERRGDLRSAKAAYRRADERGDPNGAFNLAVLLEEQNELTAAQAAYRRADQRGPAEVANAARAALLSLGEGSGGVHDRNGGNHDVE